MIDRTGMMKKKFNRARSFEKNCIDSLDDDFPGGNIQEVKSVDLFVYEMDGLEEEPQQKDSDMDE
jgi:hypothetical protein